MHLHKAESLTNTIKSLKKLHLWYYGNVVKALGIESGRYGKGCCSYMQTVQTQSNKTESPQKIHQEQHICHGFGPYVLAPPFRRVSVAYDD